jgi:hypothetical protein
LLIAPERNPSMKKLALALLTAALLGLPASPSLAAQQPVDCQEPIPVGNYDGSHMSYELAVDYSTCGWWKDSAIRLDATLARLDAEGETVADVVTLCGVGPGLDYGEPRADAHEDASCEVDVELEHPPVEVARYRGEVTFPWRDGPRTVGFTVYCASPGSVCREQR